MRRLIVPAGLAALAAAVWLWGLGGAAGLAAAAAGWQHQVQNAMAGAIRGLQGGQPGALAALWGLCLAYGFFHAAGPGHGKLLIGAYGLGRRVALGRLSLLALASSLAQALTAVLLVGAGVLLFGWQRQTMQAVADRTLAQVSAVLIGAIGLWLLWRGARAVWRLWPLAPVLVPVPVAASFPDLAGLGQPMAVGPGDDVCASCGHAHGPTLVQAQQVRGWRDGLAVVVAVAARPCTGALFLLILTWQLGLFWAGVLGALVMGLGTASVTLLVALGAVSLRESALLRVATGHGVARAMAWAEVLAGLLVIAIALQMLAMAG